MQKRHIIYLINSDKRARSGKNIRSRCLFLIIFYYLCTLNAPFVRRVQFVFNNKSTYKTNEHFI